MSTSGKIYLNKPQKTKTPTKRPGTFLRRLDLRFPWLKLAAVLCIGVIAILDLCDLTISRTGETKTTIAIAPMSHHARITKRILEGKMLLALTFDDGPSSETTTALLEILNAEDVPATFFMLGYMARNNPQIVQQIASEGHEIASHTMYHQNLARLSESDMDADIGEANTVFNEILGTVPSLTRPPYGIINDSVMAHIGTPLILWSVDTRDWETKNSDSILATTMSQVHDGAIILMHDIYPTTVEAVPMLITKLRDSGYEFVTISELAKIRGISLETNTAYYHFRP